MKLVIVVGVRPQFVKAGVLFGTMRDLEADIVLVHTGQHYDDNMSGVFFRELGLPKPKYSLTTAKGSAEEVVACMKRDLTEALKAEKPDAVVVFGDTNSTVAGALAAAETGVPLIHIEAGERAGLADNPEEQNRIKVDRISSVLLCTSEQAAANLRAEGVQGRIAVVGNLMQDAFLHYAALPWEDRAVRLLNGEQAEVPARFYLLTCHRQENSATDEPLREILTAMESLELPTVFPVHPRNRERVLRLAAELECDKVLAVEPVGYVMSAHLIANAEQVVTDSGGVLSEAFCVGVPYVFVLDLPRLPEKVPFDVTRLAKPTRASVLDKLAAPFERRAADKVWQAGAGERIVQEIVKWWRNG